MKLIGSLEMFAAFIGNQLADKHWIGHLSSLHVLMGL